MVVMVGEVFGQLVAGERAGSRAGTIRNRQNRTRRV
jgi:hypothetical protein